MPPVLSHVQFSEADMIETMEKMCNPEVDEGEWITKIDLVEDGSKLKLVDVGTVSCSRPCGSSQMRPTPQLMALHGGF